MSKESSITTPASSGALPAPIRARVPIEHGDFTVSPIGLGCMGMSQSYGPADDDESVATIRGALDLGVDMLDTSDIYGAAGVTEGLEARFGHNESLIGRAIAGRRDDAIVATKFGVFVNEAQTDVERSGRPEYVKQACEASLQRLGTDVIDLYYYHRVDPSVPIEDTVGAMGELVTAGKVRAIGLSEVDAATLTLASAVFPIAALQSEYSLWERGVEESVLPACRRLGTTLVPFSPLGRAMLTGNLAPSQTFESTDFRSTIPKFAGDNFTQNLKIVESLREFATQRGFTPGQIALAWLLAQPLNIAPIPGTKRIAYVEQNIAATTVPLSADEVAEISDMFHPRKIRGERYDNERLNAIKVSEDEDTL